MKILDRFDKLIGRFCRRNMVVFTKFIKLTERFCRRNPVVYTYLTCRRSAE